MTARRDKQKQQRAELNKQLELPQTDKKPREKDEMSMEIGKFLLDLAKLTFAGIFLTGITGMTVDAGYLVGLGALVIVLLAIVGFKYIKRGINKNSNALWH